MLAEDALDLHHRGFDVFVLLEMRLDFPGSVKRDSFHLLGCEFRVILEDLQGFLAEGVHDPVGHLRAYPFGHLHEVSDDAVCAFGKEGYVAVELELPAEFRVFRPFSMELIFLSLDRLQHVPDHGVPGIEPADQESALVIQAPQQNARQRGGDVFLEERSGHGPVSGSLVRLEKKGGGRFRCCRSPTELPKRTGRAG